MVNHNGAQHLERSLAAARQSSLRFDEMILVDNASTDRSLELVRQCYPEVTVLQLEQNDGPGAARNAGFRQARNDLILFVDNDVSIAPQCASELSAALSRRSGAVAAMPRVRYADRRDMIQYEGADCHFLGHMAPRHPDRALLGAVSDEVEVSSLITACFLLDRSLWGEQPPFDPSFIFNYEDHDLGVRSRVLGHRLIAVPSAVCLHGSGTAGLSLRPGGQQAPLRIYCLMRNRWRVILQCYATRTLLLMAPLLVLFELFQFAGCVRKRWLGVWFRAAGWMISNRGVIRAGRTRIQSARRVTDRAILQGGDLPFSRGLASSRVERAACWCFNRIAGSYWRLIQHRL
jgi:GT2 family glycosyltransferase